MELSPKPNLTPEAQRRLDALQKREQDAYNDSLYGDLESMTNSAEDRHRLEEASAYEQHLQKIAERPAESSNMLDLEALGASAAEQYGRQWDEAHEMNEQFDANKVAEAEAHKAAIQAKIDSDPQLRRVQMMTNELAELKSSMASLDADEATKQQSRVDDLEDRIQDLLGKYEDSENFDREAADTLLERATTESKADAKELVSTSGVVDEAKEAEPAPADETKEVDETDPVAQARDIAASLENSDIQAALAANPDTKKAVDEALAEAQRLADGGSIQDQLAARVAAENGQDVDAASQATDAHFAQPIKMPTQNITEQRDAQGLPQDRVDLSDPNIATMSVNGTPLYFNERATARYEGGGDNVVKRAWKSAREKFFSNRERGRKGLVPVLGAVAALTLAAGAGLGLRGDSASHEHVAADSGQTASPHTGNNGETKKPETTPKTETAHDKLVHSSAWNIPKGSGGEALMDRLNVPKSTWYKYEDGFLKAFPHEAYRMSDGHVGLSEPGKLPTAAINYWVNKIEK